MSEALTYHCDVENCEQTAKHRITYETLTERTLEFSKSYRLLHPYPTPTGFVIGDFCEEHSRDIYITGAGAWFFQNKLERLK